MATVSNGHMRNGDYLASRYGQSTSQDSLVAGAGRTSQQSYGFSSHAARLSQQDKKRLKSPYPLNSSQSHVEFILVASFDISRGSVMEHQYPGVISDDEHMLAELMLPDQAHDRDLDWTIFFLHKDAALEDEQGDDEGSPRKKRRRSRRNRASNRDELRHRPQSQDGLLDEALDGDELEEGASADEDSEDDDNELEGPPLIYVLNLVSTKRDESVARKAVCKAMAICTRHPFLHIYKPLLLLALDDYFKSPVPETLATLYAAVNAMDLSLLPRLSMMERTILQASNAKDLFMERFRRMIEQKRTESLRLSASSAQALLPESPLTPSGTNRALPRDTHEFESKIVYNSISVPVKVPTARFPENVGDFSLIKLIQTFSTPHSSSPQAFTPHPHLTTGGTLTHPIVVLINALLTQKRIVFVGYKMASGEVAEAVLAACALASGGVLRGFTRHAFPYTDLTKIDDLLKVPGFIAGVTNPHFANKPEWWDLLCDLPTGRMTISQRIEAPQMTESLNAWLVASPPPQPQSAGQDHTGDATFMESVLRAIQNRAGENTIRALWRDYILKFARIAAVFEEMVYGSSALYIGAEEVDSGAHGVRGHGFVWADEATRHRELAGNVHRIEGWRNTRSYYSLIQDLEIMYKARPITSIDLHHQHDRLRTQKMTSEASAAVYMALEEVVRTDAEICQLLTVMPESHGGLFYVALGLLHPIKEVRWTTVRLLSKIRRHEAGKHFWEGLGRFQKLAYERVAKEMERSKMEEMAERNGRREREDGEMGDEMSRSAMALESIKFHDG